jgi:hypothetical protein
MIYFSSAPIPQAETTGSRWTLDRKKRLLRSNIFVPEKGSLPSYNLFSAFCVLIRRLYAGHELVVGECGMAGETVYERQDRVMAVRNGTTEALDS